MIGYKTFNGKAYRFLGFNGLHKTIETEKLRFTNPSQFNDPLDNSSLLSPLNWKKWNEFGLTEFAEKRYTKSIFSTIYIASFSKEYRTEKSYLMWSHYGDSHKGVCFEIDFSKIKFLGNPDIVQYEKNLINIRDELYKHKDRKEDIGRFLVTYKHYIWSYEKEVRLIVDTELINNIKGFKKSNDEKYLYVDFSLNYISKVIFGINSKKEDEIITINMFKEKGVFPKYRKMKINPITLELESENYKITTT